jgi:hypothetical protein
MWQEHTVIDLHAKSSAGATVYGDAQVIMKNGGNISNLLSVWQKIV